MLLATRYSLLANSLLATFQSFFHYSILQFQQKIVILRTGFGRWLIG